MGKSFWCDNREAATHIPPCHALTLTRETGNLTVLTNVRSRAELPSDGVLSRGKVVMDFVDGDLAAAAQAALDVAQGTPAPSNVIIAGGGDDTLPPGATSMKMDGSTRVRCLQRLSGRVVAPSPGRCREKAAIGC